MLHVHVCASSVLPSQTKISRFPCLLRLSVHPHLSRVQYYVVHHVYNCSVLAAFGGLFSATTCNWKRNCRVSLCHFFLATFCTCEN